MEQNRSEVGGQKSADGDPVGSMQCAVGRAMK